MRILLLLLSVLYCFQTFSAQFYNQVHADSLKTSLTGQEGKARIHTLLHLSDCYYQIQLDSSFYYASMAIEESKELDYEWGLHKGNYQQIKVDLQRDNFLKTLVRLKREYQWFEENNFVVDAIRCRFLEINYLHLTHSAESATSFFQELLLKAKENENKKMIGELWYNYHFDQSKRMTGLKYQESLDSADYYAQLTKDSLGIIRVSLRRNRYTHALPSSTIYNFEKSVKKWGNKPLLLSIYETLIYRLTDQQKFDSVSYFIEKYKIETELYNSRAQFARYYSTIGHVSGMKNELEKARDWYVKCKEEYSKIGEHIGYYFATKRIGNIDEIFNQYESAIANFIEARKAAEKFQYKYGMAQTALSLGRMYNLTNQHEKAESSCLEAISLCEGLSGRMKSKSLAEGYETLGVLYRKKGWYKKAINRLDTAKNIWPDLGDKMMVSTTIMAVYIDAEAFKKADSVYTVIKKTYDDNQTLLRYSNGSYPAFFLLQIGRLKLYQNKNVEAIRALEEFLASSAEVKPKEDEKKANYLLYLANKGLSKWDKALYYHEEYNTLDDSIKEANAIENVALIQSRYEMAEKETELLQAKQEKEIQELTIAQQEAELKEQEQNLLLTILAFLLALSTGVLFFNRYRLKKEKKELALQSSQLELEREKEKTARQLEIAQLRSDFFTNTSHEFRTPLTLILGPLKKLLEKEELNYRNDIERINRNAEQLLSLVNETLDESKIGDGYSSLNPTRVSLGGYVRKIAHGFIPHAEAKQIDLEVVDQSELFKVDLDEIQFNKVITNLIGNAFKYTPTGGAIKVVVNAPKEEFISIEVIDSGIGIAKKDLSFVFNRFYQADTSLEGNGIGLALTKQLVELHGGTISVKSEVGEGSTFTVEIPLKQTHKIEEQLSLQQDINTFASTEGLPDLKNKTILIIEDNKEVRYYLNELLEDDYKTLLAIDGEEGAQLAEDQSPDLIISDIMMPNKDGLELTKQLKQNFSTSHIPIILLTAKASLNSKLEGLETGADDYINKPFYAEELLQRCKNLLQQREQLKELFGANYFVSPFKLTQNRVDRDFLERAEAIVENQLGNMDFTIEQFCHELAYNRTKVHRKLKALTGKNASGFIKSIRLRKAARLLQEENLNINEISEMTGFGSRETFNKAFKEQFNLTPTDFRKTDKPIPFNK